MKTFLNQMISCASIICIYSLTSTFAQNLISYTIPSQNQIHVEKNSQIIIGFNEDIIDSTLNNNSIVVYGTLSGRHFSDIYYDTLNRKMIYTPLKIFASGEKVFVSLTNEIKSISGDSLAPAFSFEFQVGSDTGYNYMTCIKYQNIVGLSTIEDMKVADLDNDGDFDLIFSSQANSPGSWKIFTYNNDGMANFQQFFEFELDQSPRSLTTADYNNDGQQDIAVAAEDKIILLRSSGNGQLHDYGSIDINYSGFIISCDFNNDGKIDLLGLEYDDSTYPEKRKVCFIKNLGYGNFEKVYSYEFVSSHSETFFYADFADLNNDGFIDLVLSIIFSDQVLFLLNDGEGNFSLETIKYFSNTTASLALGDFNGDFNVDAAISTGESGWEGLKVFKNVGNTVFVYFYSFYIHSHPWITLSTDFNNDGNLDLAIPYAYGHRIGVYLGGGDLFFNNILQVEFSPSSNPYLLDVADFDGDGDVDVVVLNDGTNGRKLYFLQNGPTISSVDDQYATLNNFSLSQNYPNPFNPITSMQYTISSKQFVTLKVYDLLGREIATLVNEEKPTGEYEIEFDGSALPSGIYFYQLKAGQYSETRKMVLIK